MKRRHRKQRSHPRLTTRPAQRKKSDFPWVWIGLFSILVASMPIAIWFEYRDVITQSVQSGMAIVRDTLVALFVGASVVAAITFVGRRHSQWRFKFRRPGVLGKPKAAAAYWHHQTGGTCAINAQRLVLQMFGLGRRESVLAARQQAYGKYKPGVGSTSVTTLLEGYGIRPTRRLIQSAEGLAFNLWDTFRQGSVALVPVNAFLVNHPDTEFHRSERPVIDHVVVATAFERNGKSESVWYTDTGHADGALRCISVSSLSQAVGQDIFVTPPIHPHAREWYFFGATMILTGLVAGLSAYWILQHLF